jgi:PilZ domain
VASTIDLCTACTSDAQCSPGNYCAFEQANETFCSPDCTSLECPAGTHCDPMTDVNGATSLNTCFPDPETCCYANGSGSNPCWDAGTISTSDMCSDCTIDADCTSGNYCVEQDVSTFRCAPDCATGNCPAGTTCFELTDSNGSTLEPVCYPSGRSCGWSLIERRQWSLRNTLTARLPSPSKSPTATEWGLLPTGEFVRDPPPRYSRCMAVGQKRSMTRLRKRLQVKFEKKEGGAGMGFTENVSATGMLVHSNFICKPGTSLTGTLQMPGGGEVRFEAQVRWASKAEGPLAQLVKNSMGLRFVVAPEERFYQLLAKSESGP